MRESRRRQRKKGFEGGQGCETVRSVDEPDGVKEKSARCLRRGACQSLVLCAKKEEVTHLGMPQLRLPLATDSSVET